MKFKAKKVRHGRQACENCPARNHDVRLVEFAGRSLYLCPQCRRIAGKITAEAQAREARAQVQGARS